MTFFMKARSLLFALLALSASLDLNANVYQHVRDQHLQTIIQEEPSVPTEQPADNKPLEFTVEVLSPFTKYDLATNMLVQHGKLHQEATDIVDSTFMKKMALIRGEQGDSRHLAKILSPDDTLSVFGNLGLASILINPTADISDLHARQKAVEAFARILKNESKSKILLAVTSTFKSTEGNYFYYWNAEQEMAKTQLSHLFYSGRLGRFNKNTAAMEASTRLNNLGTTIAVGSPLLQAAQLIFLSSAIQTYVNARQRGINLPFSEACKIALGTVKNSIIAPRESLSNFNTYLDNLSLAYQQMGVNVSPTALKTIYGLYGAWFLNQTLIQPKQSLKIARDKVNVTKHIQERLISVATTVRAAKKLHRLMLTDEATAQMPAVQQLGTFFGKNKTCSANLSKLLGMLETNTFKGEPSFFSITGRVLAAHTLMNEVKDELIPLFEAVGHIEAYVAMAKLYVSHQNKPARFCFAEFVDSTSPSIAMTNFWNPFIDAEKVVTNNAQFNDGTQRNVILTGPNTAGKSTVIKAVALNILLAQTFGICAADSVRITPFSKLNCHMNITDDIAIGASLFQAELTQARELLEGIKSLQTNQFCFTIMDELFNGTNAEGGTKAAYDFSEKLAQYNNLILVVATHFDKLTTLDQIANFKNMHVGAHLDEKGALVRPFKLQDGIFHDPENKILHALLDREGLFDSAAPAA